MIALTLVNKIDSKNLVSVDFPFIYTGLKGNDVQAIGYLFKSHREETIYLMKRATCLKAEYTAFKQVARFIK